MKTVRDYMEAAQQFTHLWSDGERIRELIEKHGVDLSMLKFVEIRRTQRAIADVHCSDCVFSREARVWTMCDKYHCKAKGVCKDLQLNEDMQDYIDRLNRHIAEIRDEDYEAFLASTCSTIYGYSFYNRDYVSDFYDCRIDESIAREVLLCLAKNELKEIEDRAADLQNRLNECREQINRTNDFIASLI